MLLIIYSNDCDLQQHLVVLKRKPNASIIDVLCLLDAEATVGPVPIGSPQAICEVKVGYLYLGPWSSLGITNRQ